MQFFIGTSGYSNKEWKGSLYPAKLAAKDMLGYYAQHFSTVEMNNTVYKMPTIDGVQAWAAQVPEEFRFILKAPQTITHRKRLTNCDGDVAAFVAAATALGERMGPLLFQLPPNFKKDVPRLAELLAMLSAVQRVTLEFRHESWLDDETYACLRDHGAALCVADAEDLPTAELIDTARWGYVRLRREDYTEQSLAAWLDRFRSQSWSEAYVLFRHEDTGAGPAFAKTLLSLAVAA
jgi:uncharacterized protein YecE (DUF72 family)